MSTALVAGLTLAAYLTATLSGVLGMGGGMLLVGVMALLLPATWVVPVHGVVQLCSNSTRTLVFLPHVRWRYFAAYSPFLLLGVAGAAAIYILILDVDSLGALYDADKLEWFKPLIGLFLLLFLGWRRYKPTLRAPPLWLYAPLGAVTGFLAMFVGATGPFIAPFFLRDDFEKEEVIATKAACQMVGHGLKIPAFLIIGFEYSAHLPLLALLVAGVILGTLTGKRLLSRLDSKLFERLFIGLLTLLALHLIGSWLLT